MPIHPAAEADVFEMHGSTFSSYLRGDRGASTLAAWRLDVAPGTQGVAHRPDHEEVLLVLGGSLTAHLDGSAHDVTAGDVVHVPAGAEVRIDSGPDGASAWVTTTLGLRARTADGELAPPWAQ